MQFTFLYILRPPNSVDLVYTSQGSKIRQISKVIFRKQKSVKQLSYRSKLVRYTRIGVSKYIKQRSGKSRNHVFVLVFGKSRNIVLAHLYYSLRLISNLLITMKSIYPILTLSGVSCPGRMCRKNNSSTYILRGRARQYKAVYYTVALSSKVNQIQVRGAVNRRLSKYI